jgi:hypothetical protein
MTRLQHIPPLYMGVDVARLVEALQTDLINFHPRALLIGLDQPREKQEEVK